MSTPSARRSFAIAALAASSVALIGLAQPTPATSLPTTRIVTPSGLTIVDQGMDVLTVQPGDIVTCHYTGKLDDGRVFDSSVTRDDPFKFRLGVDQVIKGWEEGITGMRVGQKRTLIIPPNLGYGERGSPPTIPGGATLTFELEVLYISRPPAVAPAR